MKSVFSVITELVNGGDSFAKTDLWYLATPEKFHSSPLKNDDWKPILLPFFSVASCKTLDGVPSGKLP